MIPEGRATPLANPGSIAGNVYNDLNNSGTKDGSESGFGPVQVFLDASNADTIFRLILNAGDSD